MDFVAGALFGAIVTALIVVAVLRVNRRSYELALAAHAEAHARHVAEERARTEAAIAQLRRANADLEQFAYVASHDLKEPLRTITAYLDLLWEEYRDALASEPAVTYKRYISTAAIRAVDLIADLLRFSRAGVGVELAVFPLRLAIDDAIAELNGRAATAKIEIGVSRDLLVLADRGMVARVLANLLSNGLKFVRRGETPHVIVRAAVIGDFVRVEVQDHGIGLDPAHREVIFEPFRRIYSQAEYPGTGIGLALSRRIVNAHGGEIHAESEAGAGTVIAFTLPAPPHATQEAASR